MNSSTRHNLNHIHFEGKSVARRQCFHVRGASVAAHTTAASASKAPLDEFVSWAMERAGLDAAAYRPQPLHRRLPACLRGMKVHSPRAARELLERKPHLFTKVISSLLIGVTEFFREPDVFDFLRTQFLPRLADGNQGLRIWSAACSSGAELYSMAILLSEARMLERSHLLGTDCRGDAIQCAKLGFYDAAMLKLVPDATRDTYFEAAGQHWRPIETLRRQVRWKVANLLAGVENEPWDIILWRNSAIYLESSPADTIWRRLASVLAPQGVLIAGKAERPPGDTGLMRVARCIYRVADAPMTGISGRNQQSLPRPMDKEEVLERFA
jgi:chemotaxis protein methyltransferase CheR